MTRPKAKVQERLDETRLRNRAMYLEINNHGAQLEASSVVMTRLNSFIEHMLGTEADPARGENFVNRERLSFEQRFEDDMAALLETALSEVRQAKLKPSIHLPGSPNGRP